ncbi:ATP-binding cassette domain-containing protein, partial [Betaproteobacteria bacterium PRO7]|nr:ATP-binding cassette domain-containing protein [Betaproteobacteria bacterium PRO7]
MHERSMSFSSVTCVSRSAAPGGRLLHSGPRPIIMKTVDRDVVISIRDLTKRFRAADGSCPAVLDGVSCDIHRGETLVIIGGSDCGKSTLLNCLIGELPVEGGSVLYR